MIIEQSTDPGDDETLANSGFYWRERSGVRVLVCRPLEEAGFVNGFSTRLGGVSDFPAGSLNLAGFNEDSAENIYENRRRFLAAFDSQFELALAWQVHGDTIRRVSTQDQAGDSEVRADAVVSELRGVLAGVKTADCIPVLIGDRANNAYAAVHAGWRGTASRIVSKAVATLAELYGSRAEDIVAAIGPGASGCNYEIGQDVIDAFADHKGEERFFKPTRTGHALVDLHLANRDQLKESGVPDASIYTAPFCTMERTDLFFSYRLEKQKYGKTGRLLSVIGRPY
jgi:polyphenol oxidase